MPWATVRFGMGVFFLVLAVLPMGVGGMATAAGGCARSAFFPGRSKFVAAISTESSGTSSPVPTPPPPLVVFLHGRLEPDVGEDPYAPPEKLYADFCRSLADRVPDTGGLMSPSGVILVDYADVLASRLNREPRNLRLGPVSSAIAETLLETMMTRNEIIGNKNENGEYQQQPPRRKLILVTYSMGAAMGLKLLNHLSVSLDHSLSNVAEVDRVVLIEPVWRCWLPFASSSPQIITNIPALALYGTDDSLTRDDSGRSVLGSLRPFLPNLEVASLEGGNHWGILSEDASGGDIASEGLNEDRSPDDLRKEMVDRICQFCSWESND
mmetsp:Transcript_12948/g.37970  ORF Transcript_12948/g.37970 Transcript_12948/m.37970 type:complete len:325 (-) Transcript_12948:800-1774(-)